ncbi:MAG: hypothetical protein ACPGQL_07740 [Thermoplasmatota archaeon]
MVNEELAQRLIQILDELEGRFNDQKTMSLREMGALLEREAIPHLDGYLRRSGALDYQSPKRFFQAGPNLAEVRDALKAAEVPRGLEPLLMSG